MSTENKLDLRKHQEKLRTLGLTSKMETTLKTAIKSDLSVLQDVNDQGKGISW